MCLEAAKSTSFSTCPKGAASPATTVSKQPTTRKTRAFPLTKKRHRGKAGQCWDNYWTSLYWAQGDKQAGHKFLLVRGQTQPAFPWTWHATVLISPAEWPCNWAHPESPQTQRPCPRTGNQAGGYKGGSTYCWHRANCLLDGSLLAGAGRAQAGGEACRWCS